MGLSERGRIFEKNIPSNGEMINLIFHGLSYITRRNFAHCSKFSCFLPHSEKYRATCTGGDIRVVSVSTVRIYVTYITSSAALVEPWVHK